MKTRINKKGTVTSIQICRIWFLWQMIIWFMDRRDVYRIDEIQYRRLFNRYIQGNHSTLVNFIKILCKYYQSKDLRSIEH